MKKIITLLFVLALTFSISNTSFSQANSVGLNGSFIYPSISAAYAAIGVVGAPQLIELSAAYNGSSETFPINLTGKTGTNSTKTITIRPSAGANGLTITSATTNNYLIFMRDSCNYHIIDGRPGGVTSTSANYLTVNNAFNTAANGNAGTVGIYGGDNCTYQYINATSASGTASFTGARCINIAGLTGNSSNNNSINNCVVRGGLRGVQDFGLNATTLNVGNTLRNNDIANYYNQGIQSSNNDGVLVKDNYIHFTGAFETVATFLSGMQISGNNSMVEGNELDGMTSINCTVFLGGSNFGSNNTIRNNKFHNFIPVAAVVQITGFQFSGIVNTNFSDNEIYDLPGVASTSFIVGLNFAGNGAGVDVVNVTDNKIYNLSATGPANIRAMSCFTLNGNTINIKNNFISITAPNSAAAAIFGILIGVNGTAAYSSNLHGNTVRIGGTRLGGNLGGISSYGIFKGVNTAGSAFTSKHNNVYINRTTGDDSTEFQICNVIDNLTGTISLDSNNYYATDPLGGATALWVDSLYGNSDLANYKAYASPQEANTTFNNIQVSKLRLTANFEACALPQMVTVELRSGTSPYTLIESSTGYAGGGNDDNFYFNTVTDGTPYYLVLKGVNSIATWSAAPVSFSSNYVNYDFTSALSQAYGNNQVLKNGIPSVYQGDANQDGFINSTDVILVYNDAIGFVTSPSTDFNCDGTTDVTDIILAANNSSSFVSVITPPVLDGQVITSDNTSVRSDKVSILNRFVKNQEVIRETMNAAVELTN